MRGWCTHARVRYRVLTMDLCFLRAAGVTAVLMISAWPWPPDVVLCWVSEPVDCSALE